MRATDLREPAKRLRIARAVLLIGFGVLALRAAHLSVVDRRGEVRGIDQIVTTLTVRAPRGLIVDRNGAELGLSVQAPSVYAVPAEVEDPAATARLLGKALGVEARRLEESLRKKRPFVFLKRWIAPEKAAAVRALQRKGVGLVEEPRRVYPAAELAAHVIGFPNIDGKGVRGVEEQEDGWLRGTPRRLVVERDARRRLLVSEGVDFRDTAGGDVMLTLDATLQAQAEAALVAGIARTRAKGGIVLALDPRTGEILALAERPTFDPNEFRSVPFRETRSRAFLDSFEPGSTFKVFALTAALANGTVRPSDVVDCTGPYRVPGKTIRDTHPHGRLSVPEILAVSSNVGAVKVSQALGPRAHFEALRAFGFGAPTGSGFPDEASGLLRDWRSWRPVDHATVAFGQGVSVTPIQLAAAVAALANQGVFVEPRLVAARRRPGGDWRYTGTRGERRAVSPAVAAAALQMLEGVVQEGGTGGRAALPGIRVGGKTGTAQKLDPATGRYFASRYLAWFVGTAPIEDPRLVTLVMLDEPRGLFRTGGMSAAPVFAEVAETQLERLGIDTKRPEAENPVPKLAERVTPTEDSKVREARPTAVPAPAQAPEAPRTLAVAEAPARRLPSVENLGDRILLPDFRGLTLDQVRSVTAGQPIRIEAVGTGRAVAQEPEPGSIIAGPVRRVRIRFALPAQGEG